jgi:hypothetical protein
MWIEGNGTASQYAAMRFINLLNKLVLNFMVRPVASPF